MTHTQLNTDTQKTNSHTNCSKRCVRFSCFTTHTRANNRGDSFLLLRFLVQREKTIDKLYILKGDGKHETSNQLKKTVHR